MNDNKLIAEFMGYEVNHNKCYSPKYNDGTIAPMQFHKSWDWLIPVLIKCMQTGDDTDKWDHLYNVLSELNVDKLYKAVVEFIKEYNI